MTALPYHGNEEKRYLLGTRFLMRSDQDVENKTNSQRSSHSFQRSRGRMGRRYRHLLSDLRFNVSDQPKSRPWRFQSGKSHKMLEECHNDCDLEKENFRCTNYIFLHGYECSNDDNDGEDRNGLHYDSSHVIMTSQKETKSQKRSLWLSYWKNRVQLLIRASLILSRDIECSFEGERIRLPKYWPFEDQDESHHNCLYYGKKGKRGITSHNQNGLSELCLSLHVPTLDTPTESDDDCYKTVSGIYNLEDDFPLLSSSSRGEEQTLDMRMNATIGTTLVKESSITVSTTILRTMSQDENVDNNRATTLSSYYPPHYCLYPTIAFTRIMDGCKKESALSSMSLKNPRDKHYDESELSFSHHHSQINVHDTNKWHNSKGQSTLSNHTATEISTPLQSMKLNHGDHHNLQQQYSNAEKALDNNIFNHITYPSIYLSAEESIVSDLTIMTDDSNQDGYENNAKNYQGISLFPNLLLLEVFPYDEPLCNEKEDI